MPSLSDFLDLPEEVTKSAFVVRLIEAVQRLDELMKSYAVTADIHDALGRGLGLITNAINEGRNDAAFRVERDAPLATLAVVQIARTDARSRRSHGFASLASFLLTASLSNFSGSYFWPAQVRMSRYSG
jgi:hypothetical protein